MEFRCPKVNSLLYVFHKTKELILWQPVDITSKQAPDKGHTEVVWTQFMFLDKPIPTGCNLCALQKVVLLYVKDFLVLCVQ